MTSLYETLVAVLAPLDMAVLCTTCAGSGGLLWGGARRERLHKPVDGFLIFYFLFLFYFNFFYSALGRQRLPTVLYHALETAPHVGKTHPVEPLTPLGGFDGHQSFVVGPSLCLCVGFDAANSARMCAPNCMQRFDI